MWKSEYELVTVNQYTQYKWKFISIIIILVGEISPYIWPVAFQTHIQSVGFSPRYIYVTCFVPINIFKLDIGPSNKLTVGYNGVPIHDL